MSLESSLLIASEGLFNTSQDLSVVSNNVANASTSGYSTEVTTQHSLDAGGVGMGVQTGLTVRYVNQAIQSDLFAQNSVVSELELTQSSLQPVDATLGTVGAGNDIASLLGTLQDGFATLTNDPSNVAQQSQIVSEAQLLTNGINTLSASYTTARQAAQTDLVGAIGTLNAALTSIGTLTDAIMRANDSGESVADLENVRDADLTAISKLLNVEFINQSNGGLLVETAGGLTLPINSSTDLLTMSNATIGASSGNGPGVTLDGTDITSQLLGGRIGADIALRDSTLPTYQAELDEFAQTLSTRFAATGLTLFTLPDGTVPSSTPAVVQGVTLAQGNYLGYASEITVNPAVVATPTMLRDGTATTIVNSATVSALNTNGDPGYQTLIADVLNQALGNSDSSGTLWAAANTTELGASGTLSSPYGVLAGTDLSSMASSLVSAQAQILGNTTSQLTSEKQLQLTLQTQLSAASGVSIDNEMSTMLQLENAYGANAKIIAAVQSLFNDVLALVQ